MQDARPLLRRRGDARVESRCRVRATGYRSIKLSGAAIEPGVIARGKRDRWWQANPEGQWRAGGALHIFSFHHLTVSGQPQVLDGLTAPEQRGRRGEDAGQLRIGVGVGLK